MKNLISIDLTKYNKEKLIEIANKYRLDPVSLVENKDKDFHTLYIDTNLFQIIAFTTKKNKNKLVYTDLYTDTLKSIKPLSLFKETKVPRVMNVDTILDKIGKYGIESMSEDEKKFLDSKS